MRTQPKVASSLAWGSVLWAGPSRSRASAVSHSAIHAASRRKYESISSPRPKQRALKLSSNGSFSEQNSNLSPDQFQQCVSDLVAADGNLDGRLDKAEYLMFLSLNAANYGYSWGYAANQASLSDLPLEFPMLFHTTACLCAYDQLPVSFDCCEGENGHIVVYAEGGVPNAEGMAADEAAYTRMFCTEAFYSYAVTFAPTESPTVRPTSSPETPLPTTKPSSAETPTTENPTMKSTGSPAGEPVPMAPTAKPVDAVPTEPTAPPNADPSTSAPTPLVVTPSPTKVTAIPVETPTASPTIAKTPTSRRPTPISSTNTPTASPNARPITPSPTESPSGGPTSGPTAAASTSSPAMTTKPPTDSLTPEPTPNPTRDPTTSPTAKPTALPTPSPSLPPTPPPASSLLEVDVTYGISSNCGMTAVDVMNGNYGITIREGLETATEAVVIEILNGTYPRDAMASMMSPGQGVRTKFGQLRDHALAGSHATSGRYHPAAESLPGEGVRMRVNGLPQEFGSRRDLAILEPRRQPRSNRQFRSGNVGSLRRQRRRSLVYYTTEYPAVITEMEDVQCEPQTTCMRVRSRVILVLEEGDDPVMIEQEVSSRIQASIQDGSLFDKIPLDTVFCPPTTDGPTSSPAQPGPETWWPSFSPVTTTSAPVTPAPVDPPTASPTPSPAVSRATEAPTYPRGPFKVVVQYELQNDCGLTGALIMNEVGNTLKQGLIAATTTVTVRVLNETYPRAEGGEPTRRNVRARGLAQLDFPSSSSISSTTSSSKRHRNLVYITEEYPVVIDRIIDNTWSCPQGLNCLLATSTITVVLEPGDDGAGVSRAVVSGMQNSFDDGSFFAAIPGDTVICP